MNIKDLYTTTFLKAADVDHTDDNIKKYKSVLWFNVRSKDGGGLRLTEAGFEFVRDKANIKIYEVEFPKDFSITPQILLWLDNFIESPYYITKKSITVLKEKSAFELYLFSGDIRKLGLSKAMAKRLSHN